MGVFDFRRFNGFARRGLDDKLFDDLWHHYIFNESDLHSAAYFYIREYFDKNGRPKIYVRCEPQLAGVKPDIVIFDGAKPIYAVEFKFFTKPDSINEEAMYKDLNKLADLVNEFDSMKWGFFYLVHDSEEPYSLSDALLRRHDYNKISLTSINLRRKEDTGRRRNGYDIWREEFDKLLEDHRKHS